MTSLRVLSLSAVSLLTAACASHTGGPVSAIPYVPPSDAYREPASVDGRHQQYAPGYQRFPPIMTERTGYPTQEQANFALQRSRWISTPINRVAVVSASPSAVASDARAAGVRLFACRRGGLDGVTGHVTRYRWPIVVCSSDLLSAEGRVLARVPLNFYYWQRAWHVYDPQPSYRPAPWIDYEPSPPRSRGWFGDRY